MAEPTNLVLMLLNEFRAELKRQDEARETLERRFNGIRQAVEGESFLGRCTAAEVEQRLVAIETRLGIAAGER